MSSIANSNDTHTEKQQDYFPFEFCNQLNHQCALRIGSICSFYQQQKRFKSVVKNAKITSISPSECNLSYICCNGDICSMERVTLKFTPSLKTPAEARIRIHDEYLRACNPKLSWLVTDPLTVLILFGCSTLGFLHFCYYTTDIRSSVDIPLPRTLLQNAVQVSLYFAIVVHIIEAIYVAYLSHTTLKLPLSITIQWFFLVCLAGYPFTARFLNLIPCKDKEE